MGAEAVASLGTGFAYDHVGAAPCSLLPVVVAAVPVLAFSDRVGVAVAGVLLWGAATGVQDSTVKALVADLVPIGRLGTAYGAFAAFQAVAALVGGVLAGWLYDVAPHRPRRGDRRRPADRARRCWSWCWPAGHAAPSGHAPPTRVRSMSATPSSYSITMRLHTAARPRDRRSRRHRHRLRRRHRHRASTSPTPATTAWSST